MDIMNWTKRVFKKMTTQSWVGREGRVDLGGVWGRESDQK